MTKVFVYGSLKQGYGNHGCLDGQKFICKTVTKNPNFDMISLGGFPGIVKGTHKISGELYEVDDLGLRRLDILESNGYFYQREVVSTDEGDAWMYILLDQDRYLTKYSRVSLKDNIQNWEN